MSSFTHTHVIPNQYDFLYSEEHEEIFKKNTFFFVHTMKVNGAQLKYFFNLIYFCTPQKNKL